MENNINQTERLFKNPPYRGLAEGNKWKYGVPTCDYFGNGETAFIEDMTESGIYTVKLKTIGRSTFARDSKKQTIFEGDIVSVEVADDYECSGVVRYFDEYCAFYIDIPGTDTIIPFRSVKHITGVDGVYFPDVTIKGNIHQNPQKIMR